MNLNQMTPDYFIFFSDEWTRFLLNMAMSVLVSGNINMPLFNLFSFPPQESANTEVKCNRVLSHELYVRLKSKWAVVHNSPFLGLLILKLKLTLRLKRRVYQFLILSSFFVTF